MLLRLLLIISLLACPYCCKSSGGLGKVAQQTAVCPCCAKVATPPADASGSPANVPSKAPVAHNCFCVGAVPAKTNVQLDKPAAAFHAIAVAGGHMLFSVGQAASRDLPADSCGPSGRDLRTLFVSLRC